MQTHHFHRGEPWLSPATVALRVQLFPAQPTKLRASLLVLHYVTVHLSLGGCNVPRDPDGTYERVHGGTMRIGITHNPPWTKVQEANPSGIDVQLVQGFARELDARIKWRIGSESRLIELVKHNELDLVIGGFVESSPWAADLGATRPYAAHEGKQYVMLVPQGENRWLLELDRFLQRRKSPIKNILEGEAFR